MVSDRKRRKYLSEGELQILLSNVKSRADLARERGTTRAIIDELIVLLSARAGLRANEIRALKIEDIPTVHGERTLRIRSAMGEVIRVVDISEDVAQLLTRFVRLYRKGAKSKWTYSDSRLIFLPVRLRSEPALSLSNGAGCGSSSFFLPSVKSVESVVSIWCLSVLIRVNSWLGVPWLRPQGALRAFLAQ